MIRPTLEEARTLSTGYKVIPIGLEMFSDVTTSIEILKKLKQKKSECFLLESVENGTGWGRFSFLGYNPKLKITCEDGVVKTNDVEVKNSNPHSVIRDYLKEYKSAKVDFFPPFTGGFVGYFAYDYFKYVEKTLKLEGNNPYNFDDYNLMLFDEVIAFDHHKQKIFLIVNIMVTNLEENYINAISTLKDMEHMILSEKVVITKESKLTSDFVGLFSKEAFCNNVEKAKHHIKEGDIFQVVLSNRFEASFKGDLFQIYRTLRTINPSPYMFYINFENVEIAGASPETLVSVKDGVATTYPLAGTCKRGKTEEEDKALIASLLNNKKELSEHDMLVDLGRNDIGKISEFGSVKVDEYRNIKKFSHVSHISSKVTGKIKNDFDQLDAVMAVLPAGTLSGAPKKRACEIIDALENQKRGIYGGAIGYIDFTGNMDLCIGIRMAVLKDEKIFVQSGAGIVKDSIPENEYEECVNKSKAMMNAIKLATGGKI